MKKTYISPNVEIVKLKYTTLLVSYSTTQAAADAEVFGHETDGDWDDDEEY